MAHEKKLLQKLALCGKSMPTTANRVSTNSFKQQLCLQAKFLCIREWSNFVGSESVGFCPGASKDQLSSGNNI